MELPRTFYVAKVTLLGPESSSAWEEELPVFRDTEGRSTAGLGVAIVSGSL